MKRKKILLFTTVALSFGVLAGCGGDSGNTSKGRIYFWTGFGAAVNGVLEPLIARYQAANPDYTIEYETKGGYENLQTAIKGSISTGKYPHLANGYPDHFADYISSNIVTDLNTEEYLNNPETGVAEGLFYQDFMNENEQMVDGKTVGLPFNKSTEVMVANQTFFDVAKVKDPTIFVPATWEDLAIVGPKLKDVAKNNGWFGKLVKPDGSTVEKPTEKPDQAFIDSIAFDMSAVKEAEFRPFSWDSTANFFITVIKQWGATYTERGATIRSGKIKFIEGESREKTEAALTFFQDLFDDGVVGIPANYGESLYSSNPFKNGRIVLTISSSAGVKENLPNAITDYPFETSIRPIPYNAANPDKKFVISQGTNLALLKRSKNAEENAYVWGLMKYLTSEVNHEFGIGTSYFPVYDGSKLAVDETNKQYLDYKMYTDFLAETGGSPGALVVRETANMNRSEYMDAANGWNKFADPGFIGSSTIRKEVAFVMGMLFEAPDAAGRKSPTQVINQLKNTLSAYK